MHSCMTKTYTPPKFSNLISLYEHFDKLEKEMVSVYAAQHLLNDLLVEFKHLLTTKCRINLSPIQNADLQLHELAFTYDVLGNLEFGEFHNLLHLHEEIDNAVDLLNSKIHDAINSGVQISISVFCIDSSNVCLAVCEKQVRKERK